MEKDNKYEKLSKLFRDFCWMLTLLFTSLRACDVNNWSWYWVISPILVYYSIELIAVIYLGLVKTGEITKGNELNEDNHKPR
jgi:hypothetical protein